MLSVPSSMPCRPSSAIIDLCGWATIPKKFFCVQHDIVLPGNVLLEMVLSQEEIEKCREAFERFDKDGSGTIDAWELKETLKVVNSDFSCHIF